MATPTAGMLAPDFHAETDAGPLRLSSLLGKKIVLYFYPKDSTPGCTIEAQEFGALHARFAAAGAVVLGISKDSVKSHQKFRAKECLPFALVSDPGGICEAYGAWRDKKLYGREYKGIARITFLVDERGTIAEVWDPVTARGHALQVLARIEGPRPAP